MEEKVKTIVEARELRIGNYIKYRDKVIVVTMVGYNVIHDEYDDYFDDELNPIPLTEEWLLKLGFERLVDFDNGFDNPEYNWVKDILNDDFYLLEENSYFIYQFVRRKKIQYVHQLQNLYFEATGKELTIKE